MNADVAVARPLRAALQREWLLLVFAAVGVALAWIDPQPASAYRRWLHVPSLAGLTKRGAPPTSVCACTSSEAARGGRGITKRPSRSVRPRASTLPRPSVSAATAPAFSSR